MEYFEQGQYEIERKWLVRSLPTIKPTYKGSTIIQGYAVVGIDSFTRIREKTTIPYLYGPPPVRKHTLDIKRGSGLKRLEVSLVLNTAQFHEMWPLTEGRRVSKTRIEIPLYDKYTAELDLFENELAGFKCVEVEFPSEDEANAFVAPDWFGVEVTDNEGYDNLHLACLGLPVDTL